MNEAARRQAALLRLSTAIAAAEDEDQICHAVVSGLEDKHIGYNFVGLFLVDETTGDRVMRASSGGDNATVTRFAPMAISAYAMLDSVDIDARYDVAVIKLHVGDIAGATALADTIVRADPKHLFGYMLRATVARFSGDSAGARAAVAVFRRNYDAELRRARPEYEEHRTSIEAFKAQVDAAR